MTRRGLRFFNAGNGTQLFDILTIEIASLVAMGMREEAAMTYEVVTRKPGCCVCSLDLGWGLGRHCRRKNVDDPISATGGSGSILTT